MNAALLMALGSATTAAALAGAVERVPPDLTGLPWQSIGLAGLLSLYGGMASTLGRMPKLPPATNLWFEFGKDAVISSVCGMGVYLYAADQVPPWTIWKLALGLLVAGYGGAKLIDAVLEWAVYSRLRPPPPPSPPPAGQ